MNRLLTYLGIGLCATLLTVFLSLSHGAVAFPTPQSSGITQVAPDPLEEQGRQYYREGRYADAISTWQQALSISINQANQIQQASILSNLALAYRQLGQWDQANQAIRDSLSGLEQFETLTIEGLSVLAQALNTQGSLQLAQGLAEAALTSWEQATVVYQQAGESNGVARSLMNQAIALRALGFHRRALGQLEQVEAQLNEQSDPQLRVALLRSLGETERLLGNLERSHQHLSESLQLAKQLDLPNEATASLISLGNTLQMQAQHQATLAERTGNAETQADADALLQEALSRYQEAVDQSSSPLNRVQAQLNQLDIVIHLQAWSEAQTLWQRLADPISHLPVSRSSMDTTIKLAENLTTIRLQAECQTDFCPSVQYIEQLLITARQQAQALNDPQAESYALGNLGHLYEQIDQLSSALELTERALNLAQRHQASEISYRWQWQLGRLHQTQGNVVNALTAYDAAFRNVQNLRNDLLFLSSDIQFTFRDRIEPLYREYVDLLLPVETNAVPTNQQAQTIQAEIAQEVMADLRLAELENFLACSLINSENTDELASIDAVANADNRTAIVYPIILGDRLEVLLKRPNESILRYPSALVSQEMLERTLDQLRKSLEQPYFSSNRGKPTAAQVYEWLIQPAEHQGWLDPTQIDTLVFVLDGKFRNIPMAALYDLSSSQFLVEKYAIAVTFGDLQLPELPPSNQFQGLLASLSNTPDASGFAPLTYVPVEILNIEQVLQRTKILENNRFTQNAIETEINVSPYTIVHLATHGEFGYNREETFLLVASPLITSLSESLLAVEKINLNQLDSLLRTRNQAPIELLVLSACETATGDDREVLGIAGMAVQAGARSTLATLWSINDSSTAVLMKAFYEGLVNQHLPKAQALRQAQHQLIQNPAYNPSDWAPYLLVGDWR